LTLNDNISVSKPPYIFRYEYTAEPFAVAASERLERGDQPGDVHPADTGRGAARQDAADQGPEPAADHSGVGVQEAAASVGHGAHAQLLAARHDQHAGLLSDGAAEWPRLDRLPQQADERLAVLHVLLHGGHQGAVPGGTGAQEALVALPHPVHDVVPAVRGAQGDHRRV